MKTTVPPLALAPIPLRRDLVPTEPPRLGLLDPKNDFVFKTMLTRRVELLRHMLEGVLGRAIRMVRVIDPDIAGEQVRDKEIVLDVRAVLDDGSRAIIEMQLRLTPALPGRWAYYLARDFVDQLRRGEDYGLLTPSVVIVWLPRPLLPELAGVLHSTFELRERRRGIALGQHLSIHVIQLSALSPATATGYDAIVERWGRFFVGYDDPEVLARLAAEDPIMAVATQTLKEISQDPELRRRALEREDARKLYRIDLRACRDEAQAELLLEQLGARFGAPSEAIRARVRGGTAEALRTWGLRVLGAKSLADVFEGASMDDDRRAPTT